MKYGQLENFNYIALASKLLPTFENQGKNGKREFSLQIFICKFVNYMETKLEEIVYDLHMLRKYFAIFDQILFIFFLPQPLSIYKRCRLVWIDCAAVIGLI